MEYSNVNDMYAGLLGHLYLHGEEEETRHGKATVYPVPLMVRVMYPEHRVLFDEKRRANPFFHLVEAVWMMAGRRDVATMAYYNKNMRSYSDDGEVFHAAYGYRWRNHFGGDQILSVANMLAKNPQDRRAVITMWDPDHDLSSQGLDIPCNQQAMFRIQQGTLNMLTTNRSNDLVWGLCGANAVHLTFLQEYLAAAIGVPIGCWWHTTNNLHIYEHHYDLMGVIDAPDDYYPETQPLIDGHPEYFLADCAAAIDGEWNTIRTPFIRETVLPVMRAWRAHKDGYPQKALAMAGTIEAEDWRIACTNWLETV